MKSVALLDGGLGQEIYRRARDVSSPLWSVAVMREQPDVVIDVHADFIRAGARTLTLNTYAATPTRLAREGLGDEIGAIHQRAFEVLERAIAITGADVDIAGCLPPLVGSYRGQPARTFEDLKSEFDILVKLQGGADVFLIETMTNSLEASAACAAAGESGKPSEWHSDWKPMASSGPEKPSQRLSKRLSRQRQRLSCSIAAIRK